MPRTILAALLATTAAAAPAQAAVIFEFQPVEIGSVPGGPGTLRSMEGRMTVADEAAASGAITLGSVLDLALVFNAHPPVGLHGSPFGAARAAEALIQGNELVSGILQNFHPDFSFRMTAGPDGLWGGTYITDDQTQDACFLSNFPCTYSGKWLRAEVPEPAPLAAILAGGAALAWRRRR